ncbi:MAG: inorganic diphosphatase [Pyrinomonadaceae bacterium]
MIDLDPLDAETGHANAIIETPKGSRNKFNYDAKLGLFKLGGPLPLGTVFPFDFGYLPSTIAGDGDPVDILVLMDEPAFPGCLVPAKLIGVIEANQTEGQETTRNDRLIAVSADSRNHSHVRFLGDLNNNLIHEIERFFVSYNETKGKRFEIMGRFGPERAISLIEQAAETFQTSRTSKKKSSHKKSR